MAAVTNPSVQPFDLRRRFAIMSLGVILGIALGLGWLLSSMLTERMLRREGEVSMEFIQNLLATDNSEHFLSNPSSKVLEARFVDSMNHLSSMTEPVRAKAYSLDGVVVWSTDRSLVGQHDPDNQELMQALKGNLVVHSGTLGASDKKQEHAGLDVRNNYYVESYIPVLEPRGRKVVGVVELYKVPLQLNASIREALLQLWLACAASAAVIFAGLNGVVRRADRVMREQQARLAESQALTSAVELAGAVAHNLRNPLASIRTSAEMMGSASDPADCAEHCDDIMGSVDRANRWITELVRVSNAPQLMLEAVATAPLWRDCLQELQPEMDRTRVTWKMQDGEPPPVSAHPAMLQQILLSVLANAIEAMPQGGQVRIGWALAGDRLRMSLSDDGTGISEDARRALFRPFFSTKSGGLGIGLALARRTLEHWNGSIDLGSEPGGGSRLTISLPLAAAAPAPAIVSQEVSNGAVAGH